MPFEKDFMLAKGAEIEEKCIMKRQRGFRPRTIPAFERCIPGTPLVTELELEMPIQMILPCKVCLDTALHIGMALAD